MMKIHILICLSMLLSSCSSYRLVDTSDCESVQGSIKICREVK